MAVKNYNATDRTQLSKHFNASEFRCKCGKLHEIKIDTHLIETLEKLLEAVGADKCFVSSGHRCEAHDKAVGGSGGGYHTKGMAADVCFYNGGEPISSKIVSCKAQDMGVTGIANINKSYTWIHIDVRPHGKYYGDETKGYNTVTNDFYKYYSMSKNKIDNADNAVKTWQNAALQDGFTLESGADGIWGKECNAAAKKAICKRSGNGYTNKSLTKIVQKIVGVEADGLFGKNTEKAVKEYQQKHGLTADGIVGLQTWKKILNID